jgi:hypothetical protein
MSEKIDQNQAKVSELEAKAKKEEKVKELSGELEKHHETFFGAVDTAQESLTKGESQLQEPQNKQVLKTFGGDIQGYLENVAITGEALYQSQLKGGPSTGKEKIAAEAGKMNERVGEIEKGLPVLKACEYATSQENEASKTYIDWAKNILKDGKLGEEKLTPAKKRELVTGAADKAVDMLASAKKELKQSSGVPDILADYYRATMDTVNSALEETGKLKLFYETKDFTDQEEYAKYFVMNEQTGEVKKTEEFDQLPIEKQNELLMKLHGLKTKVADEIEEKCALDDEEKLFFQGKKMMVSGDLTFAKKDFLAFIDHFSAKKEKSPEEETRIKECKEYLKQIGLLEVSTVRQRLALMKKSIDARFASVTNPGQLESGVSYAEAKLSMDQMAHVLDMAESRIELGESSTLEEVNQKFLTMDLKSIDPHYEDDKFALAAFRKNFATGNEPHSIFNVLQTQLELNKETDPKKKQAMILALAKEAYTKGMPDLARQYYDQYFLPEINKKTKEISKSDFTQDLLGKTDFQKQLNSRVDSLEPELRETLSKEWNHKYSPDGVTAARQAELEAKGISFDSELKKAMDTEKEKIQGSMIDEEYLKVVKTEVHKDFKAYTDAYSNVEGGGPKADRAGAWNEVYGNTFHNLDSFDTHWYEVWKFSDEEWNKFKTMAIVDIGTLMVSGGMATVAAEGLVGVAVMERLAVAGVSKVVVNEALKKGSVYFAMLVMKELGWKEAVKMGLGHFIVESGVFHTVHSSLQSGVYGTSEAFTDPLAFFESWGAGALQFGAVKVAHLGFSFKPSSESFLGKIADKFIASTGSVGVQNLTGLALMAMSGEEVTEEKIAKMQQNNIVFEVGVGLAHAVIGKGSGESEVKEEGGKEKPVKNKEGEKETIKVPDELITKITKTKEKLNPEEATRIINAVSDGALDPITLRSLVETNRIEVNDKTVKAWINNNPYEGLLLANMRGVILTDAIKIDALKKILTRTDGFVQTSDLFESGILDPTLPGVVELLTQNDNGIAVCLNLVMQGNVKLTEEMLHAIISKQAGLEAIEYIEIAGHEGLLAPGLSMEKLKFIIENERSILRDGALMHKTALNLGTNLGPELELSISRIETGKMDVQNEIDAALERLKQRDPVGYRILSSNSTNLDVNYIQAIIQGSRVEFSDTNGQRIIAYDGGHIASGGMGAVYRVAYVVEGSSELKYAVIKRPHEHTKEQFEKEKQSAELVQAWDSEYINKSLHIGEEAIIYETGKNSKSMSERLPTLSDYDAVGVLIDSLRGVAEYQKRGYLHGDLKEANILIIDTKRGPRAQLIDNSPVSKDNTGTEGWAYTPSYTSQFVMAKTISGGPREFRVYDNYSMAIIAQNIYRTRGIVGMEKVVSVLWGLGTGALPITIDLAITQLEAIRPHLPKSPPRVNKPIKPNMAIY